MPAVVDTYKANADQDFLLISLQGNNQREDVSDDHWVGVGREMGMQHDMGETSYFGEWSPYFNLNKNSSTTYAFIIDRTGLIRWRGDMGTQVDEYYAALRAALEEPVAPPMGAALGPAFEKVSAALGEGQRGKAISELKKVLKRFGGKSKPKDQALAKQAQGLMESLEQYSRDLLSTMQQAVASQAAESYVLSRAALENGYPKGEATKSIKAIEKEAKKEADFYAQIKDWEAWLELAAKRPATFPARKDKAGAKYARKLEKYLKGGDTQPGWERASQWTTSWRALQK